MLQSLRIVTAPAELPVSLAVARGHLRLDYDDDDELLLQYIGAATEAAEAFLARALVTQTYAYTVGDRLPSASTYGMVAQFVLPLSLSWSGLWQRGLELPRSPVSSVLSVSLTGFDGTSTSLTSDDYLATLDTEPGRLRLTGFGGSTLAGYTTVRFTAGYGPASAVPRMIVQAILLLTAWLYENRGDANEPDLWPSAVRALLWPHRLIAFG